jgi:hypothetical protein
MSHETVGIQNKQLKTIFFIFMYSMRDNLMYLLPHEKNRNRKPLLKTIETEQSSFRNQTLRFCQDRWQSGAPSDCDEVLLLQPNGVWTMERREPWQLWRLKWQLIDLIDKKENETKK